MIANFYKAYIDNISYINLGVHSVKGSILAGMSVKKGYDIAHTIRQPEKRGSKREEWGWQVCHLLSFGSDLFQTSGHIIKAVHSIWGVAKAAFSLVASFFIIASVLNVARLARDCREIHRSFQISDAVHQMENSENKKFRLGGQVGFHLGIPDRDDRATVEEVVKDILVEGNSVKDRVVIRRAFLSKKVTSILDLTADLLATAVLVSAIVAIVLGTTYLIGPAILSVSIVSGTISLFSQGIGLYHWWKSKKVVERCMDYRFIELVGENLHEHPEHPQVQDEMKQP